MSSYDRLVKDFFQKFNPSNPLHYYGYKHIVRGEDERSEEGLHLQHAHKSISRRIEKESRKRYETPKLRLNKKETETKT